MLKLQRKYVLLIVIINFNILGCGKLPIKPSIDSGIVIAEENIIFYVNNQTGEEKEVQVCSADGKINPKLDKEITHNNEDWNKVLLYIRLLENSVPKRVKKELEKYRASFEHLERLNEKSNGK